MSGARADGGFPLSASLSLLLPFLQAPAVPSSPFRHARRLALYILSRQNHEVHADSNEMAERCLKREHLLARSQFQPFGNIHLPEGPEAYNTLKQACAPHAFQLIGWPRTQAISP